MLEVLKNAYYKIIWFLNGLVGAPSSEQYLKEQEESYSTTVTDSYQMLKKAGGRRKVSLGVLAQNQEKLARANADLDQAILEKQSLTGKKAEAKQSEIDRRVTMVTGLQTLVDSMQAMLNAGAQNQDNAELGFDALQNQRDLANAEAGMDVDREAFAKMMEELADLQMQATGIIKGGKLKDNRSILRKRADEAEGRAETATRLASRYTNAPKQTAVRSAAEQSVYEQALKRTGVVSEQAATPKSESAS